MPWPAAACSPGRASPPTATPGNSRPFCHQMGVCARVVCSPGWTCGDPALRDCEARMRTEFSPCLQPALSGESGISVGELGRAFRGQCGNHSPERKGCLLKKVEPEDGAQTSLSVWCSLSHFVLFSISSQFLISESIWGSVKPICCKRSLSIHDPRCVLYPGSILSPFLQPLSFVSSSWAIAPLLPSLLLCRVIPNSWQVLSDEPEFRFRVSESRKLQWVCKKGGEESREDLAKHH